MISYWTFISISLEVGDSLYFFMYFVIGLCGARPADDGRDYMRAGARETSSTVAGMLAARRDGADGLHGTRVRRSARLHCSLRQEQSVGRKNREKSGHI
jgi:hypothetical protein